MFLFSHLSQPLSLSPQTCPLLSLNCPNPTTHESTNRTLNRFLNLWFLKIQSPYQFSGFEIIKPYPYHAIASNWSPYTIKIRADQGSADLQSMQAFRRSSIWRFGFHFITEVCCMRIWNGLWAALPQSDGTARSSNMTPTDPLSKIWEMQIFCYRVRCLYCRLGVGYEP